MMPVVFKLGSFSIPGYGLMLTLGFLIGIWWAVKRAERSGANPDVILNCGFIGLICGIVGCRAMYVIHYWDHYMIFPTWQQRLWEIVNVSKGGLEFYGGFLLATVGVLFYFWRWKHSTRWYLDIIAPSVALGQAFGRVGCFLNGCCWGGVCTLPWTVQFPYGSNAMVEHWAAREPGTGLPQELIYFPQGIPNPISRESLAATPQELEAAEREQAALDQKGIELRQKLAAATDPNEREDLQAKIDALTFAGRFGDVRHNMKKYGLTIEQLRALAAPRRSAPVHPAQLYATAGLVLLALALNELYKRRTRDGQVICALFLVEPTSRWLLETVRVDNPKDVFGIFTISQFLAICFTTVALICLIALRKMPARAATARLWTPEAEPATAGKKK